MKKRKYTKVETMEAEIMEMRGAGKTRREIGERLGLTLKQVEMCPSRFRGQ